MAHIFTIMHVVPGKEDLFEAYYRKRKIRFIWEKIPGLIDYQVFRVKRRANRDGLTGLPYQFTAIIEVKDVEKVMDYFYGPEYRDFLGEYAPLFHPNDTIQGGGLYVVDRLEGEDLQSKEQFWKSKLVTAG